MKLKLKLKRYYVADLQIGDHKQGVLVGTN